MDLQDQDAPSAQDHSRQPIHPNPLGIGRPAPHQSQALLDAELETREELTKAQHMVDGESDLEFRHNGINIVYDEHDNIITDPAMNENNGHYYHNVEDVSGEEIDPQDNEEDDMLDDDMIDKISSSPSIDDGKRVVLHFITQSIPLQVLQLFESERQCSGNEQ